MQLLVCKYLNCTREITRAFLATSSMTIQELTDACCLLLKEEATTRRILSTMFLETRTRPEMSSYLQIFGLTKVGYDAFFKGVKKALGLDVCKAHCYNIAVMLIGVSTE